MESPLMSKSRIRKRSGIISRAAHALTLQCRFTHISTFRIVCTLDVAVRLNLRHLTQLAKTLYRLLQVCVLIKLHTIPQMKARFTCARFILFVYRKMRSKEYAPKISRTSSVDGIPERLIPPLLEARLNVWSRMSVISGET